MGIGDLLGDAIDEVPDVVGELAARAEFGGFLAFAKLALADRGVAVGRHDGHDVHLVVIELDLGEADDFAEEFLVGVTELVFLDFGVVVSLAAVKGEPLGMVFHGLKVVAEGTELKDSHREIRTDGFVDLRQGNRRQRGDYLADLSRHVPTHAEATQVVAYGVERTAFVVDPNVHIAVRVSLLFVGRPKYMMGAGVVFVDLPVRVAPALAGDRVPFSLDLAAPIVLAALWPGFDWYEIGVVADEYHPVFSRDDAVGAMAKPFGGDASDRHFCR